MVFSFPDRKSQALYRAFLESLNYEFQFIRAIAKGDFKTRQDQMDQILKGLAKVCGFASGIFSGAEIGKYICMYVLDQKDKASTAKARNFMLSLENDDNKNMIYFEVIAREVVYRFGSIILNAVEKNLATASHVHDAIVRVGTIRMLDYAMINGIGLEDYEGLFIGLIQGYQGLYGQKLKTKIGEEQSMSQKVLKGGDMTVEGLFARSGFVSPSDLHIKFSVRGKGPKDSTDYGHVKFKPQYDAKKKEIQVSHDNLVPKYGYVAVPHEGKSFGLISSYHFITQAEAAHNTANFAVNLIKGFQYRYVSDKHILEYLAAKSSQSFNAWLGTKYPQHFARGLSVHAVCHGAKFDEKVLKRYVPGFSPSVSFADGNFEEVDFSFCEFKNVTFSNMKSCLLLGCTFENCTATGSAMSRADLSFSTMKDCVFRGLTGFLTVSHVNAVHCDFSGCRFTSLVGGADIGDKFTMESFESSTLNCAENGTGGESAGKVLEEIRAQIALDRERERARRELERSESAKEENKLLHENELNLISRLKAERENLSLRNKLSFLEREAKRNAAQSSEEYEVDEGDEIIDETGTAMVKLRRKMYNRVDKDLMTLSIKTLTSLRDSVINQVYDAQYFNRAVSYLRHLEEIDWLKLQRSFTYDTSGKNGEPGTNGDPGGDGGYGGVSGGNGLSGQSGDQGINAANCEISLMSVPLHNVFLVTRKNKAEDPTMMPLFDPKVSIALIARGGKGGDGGNGGRGGNGSDGVDGQDATKYAQGTSGTNGGGGGNGGHGANGMNSGNSGNIDVNVKECDADLLYLISTDCDAVKGGKGGAYGTGGIGGRGGRGGASYEYSEQVPNGVDSEGRARYKTVYRTMAGGQSGAAGKDGSKGNNGRNGADGDPGKYTIRLFATEGGAVEEYVSLYNLKLIEYTPYVSDTGVIEPGQQLCCTGFVIGNIGGMPSPATGVVMSIESNALLSIPVNKCEISEAVRHDFRKTLSADTRLDFSVARMSTPLPNTVVDLKTPVVFKAELCRIRKEFPVFKEAKPQVLHIQYPVELSVIRAGLTVTSEDTVPLTIKVRNISLVALGMNSNNPRHLIVNVYIPHADKYSALQPVLRTGTDRDVSNHVDTSLSSPLAFEIRYLGAQSEVELTATLSLRNTSREVMNGLLYARLPICYSLALGDIDRPTHDMSVNVIQNEIVALQIADVRQSGIHARTDILLVCNGNTTKLEIDHWTAVAKSLDMVLVVWNVSVYNGFSYANPHYNLMSDFKNGIVVFLNTPMHRTDNAAYFPDQGAFMPIDYLEPYEMFEAARRHGIRTYVINSKLNEDAATVPVFPARCTPSADFYNGGITLDSRSIKVSESTKHSNRKGLCKALNDVMENNIPYEHLPAKYELVTIKKTHVFTTPTIAALDLKLSGLKSDVAGLNPSHSYFYKKKFEVVKLGGVIAKSYQCGEIEVRRGLDTTYAMMAARTTDFNSTHCDAAADKFVLAKLMSFTKKLEVLVQNKDEFSASVVLSDIVDEQVVYLNYVKAYGGKNIKEDQLLKAMTALATFAHYSFVELVNTVGGAEILQDIVVKLRYFASFYASSVGKAFGSRSGGLKNVVKEVCDTLMTTYFPAVDLKKDFQALRNTLSEKMNKTKDFDVVALAFSDPYGVQKTSAVSFNHTTAVKAADSEITADGANNTVSSNSLITESSLFDFSGGRSGEQVKTTSRYLQHNKFRKAALPDNGYYCDSDGAVKLNNAAEKGVAKMVLHATSFAEEVVSWRERAELAKAAAADAALNTPGTPSAPALLSPIDTEEKDSGLHTFSGSTDNEAVTPTAPSANKLGRPGSFGAAGSESIGEEADLAMAVAF